MRLGRNGMDELCYAAEGLSGTAAATSLRKLGSIMERAPSGRLFDSISTLANLSSRAARALEEGSLALDRADHTKAVGRIATAMARMDALTQMAQDEKAPAKKARRPSRR
jgi:hypothetical protein